MHPWVTTSVPVLKTTRFPYSNRRCCHIRVFHPYLTAWSPLLIILWHGLRGGFGHALPALHGHVRGDGRTLMNHLLPYGTHVSSPFWSTWFIIHLCSCWGWTVISGKVPGSIPRLSVQVSSHFVPRSEDIQLRWTGLFSANTTIKIHIFHLLNSLYSEDSDAQSRRPTHFVCFHRQWYLASSRPSLVCIPQKRSLTSEWWNVQCPDGPPWQPLHPWKASLSAKIGCYQAQILLHYSS